MKILYTIIITFLLTLGLAFLLFSSKEVIDTPADHTPKPIINTPIAATLQHDSHITDTIVQAKTIKPKREKKRKKNNNITNKKDIEQEIETIEHLIEIKKASEAKIYHFEKQIIDLERNNNIFNKRKREEKIVMTKQFLDEARISLRQIDLRINQHMQEKNK